MLNALVRVPEPENEPELSYLPGSPERAALVAELERQSNETIEVPLLIGGREVRTGNTVNALVPHEHGRVLAVVHLAGDREVDAAIASSIEARREWSETPAETRSAIFLKAAELLSGPWRMRINAATMLNQSKTCHQAEIDASCELIDFFRFNCFFMEQIHEWLQPASPPGIWNRLECRPLEGFTYAITPFNFTSIGGNLPSSPVVMGNVAIWKPSHSAVYSNYLIMRLLEEAGLPPGVMNFVAGSARAVSARIFAHREFAGVHYTGSTEIFRSIWLEIARNLPQYRDYPRIVGETGGKDFVFAHGSADPSALVTGLVRGAFEYQGQKCSAASRAYVPRSLWKSMRDELVGAIRAIGVGDVADFSNFMGAVIHRESFEKCKHYIEEARKSRDAEILAGGGCDDSRGFFVEPTLILAKKPDYSSICEEIFGPILTVYVYEDGAFEETLRLCDETSPYALTGAIFAQERSAIERASSVLRYAAGNFYINDKPTGAVVGQQPFGGGRASGTNDKAGSALNLLRWITPRTIKEAFDPPREWRYGFMGSGQ